MLVAVFENPVKSLIFLETGPLSFYALQLSKVGFGTTMTWTGTTEQSPILERDPARAGGARW